MIEPHVTPVKLAALRPTQLTVGRREVEEKRSRWAKMKKRGRQRYLEGHFVPVVRGPGKQLYLIDHHHEGLALLFEGQKEVLTHLQADLSALGKDEFWALMAMRGWCHLMDWKGRVRPPGDLPTSLRGLSNDSYRSLAGEVRRAGGYAKTEAPFSEFQWATFFRYHLKGDPDGKHALGRAVKLARGEAARHLPGWCGPG